MIIPGLTTATTRHLSIEETVGIVCESGLQGIEWEANRHVTPGNLEAAEKARALCASNKLVIPSYGSYYKAGVSEESGMPFQSVLDTARALEAPSIRIWAGEQDYEKSDAAYIDIVVSDTLRIADMAAEKEKTLIFEFHSNTLTNTTDYALQFAIQVKHPAVTFSWQPIHTKTQEECENSLSKILPLLNTLHVFHWDMGPYSDRGYTKAQFIQEGLRWIRHPLNKGSDRWRSYLKIANTSTRTHWALLEFTKGDSSEQLCRDAETLRSLLGEIN
jgi:sugar phosphate isomerase/epimerase